MVSEATKFFRNFIEGALLGINTAMPCEVISYNESDLTAKIQPLFMTKEVGREPEALPVLDNVPVLFQRFKFVDRDNGSHTVTQDFIPILKSGDIVLCVFVQRAMDNVMDGKVAYPSINRHHSLKDAVIVGVFGWKR